MNLITTPPPIMQLFKAADQWQEISNFLRAYDGDDKEILEYRERFYKEHWKLIAAGASRPLFDGRVDRRFRARSLPVTLSLEEEPQEPEEEEGEEETDETEEGS